MTDSTIWWVLAGLVVGAELLTGTFYLLMVSAGLIGAAIAAHLGVSLPFQIAVAALLGGGLSVALRFYRKAAAAKNPLSKTDGNLDVGARVMVDAWATDGTAQVKYRGANWVAMPVTGETPTPGMHQIEEVVGSRLLIKKL
ncbi:NfeD family protein [Uliginosibacterium flavum]|uniref:NfeD family protein n=1 Tax=Uliginosibacterium flavum TaxID=1396831 RepID=A0ABV2TKM4_9RHOO